MKLNKIALAILLYAGLLSCKKQYNEYAGGTALNMVNVMQGSTYLIAGFNNTAPIQYYKWAFQLGFGSFNVYTGYSGVSSISFVDLADTNHILFTANFDLGKTGIHSLYVAGTIDQPDTLYKEDIIPVYPVADSVTGIRFVNLSIDKVPISINKEGDANGSAVASLSFKQVTDFYKYPAKITDPENGQYVFEIRNAESGDLLSTCTYYVNSWVSTTGKNVTIVFYGEAGGAGNYPPNSMLVNNY